MRQQKHMNVGTGEKMLSQWRHPFAQWRNAAHATLTTPCYWGCMLKHAYSSTCSRTIAGALRKSKLMIFFHVQKFVEKIKHHKF
jgi:hypothetical protein